MRTLTWDNIDFDNGVLELEQSKRRADVTLPISDSLLHMIKEQKKDFGFQTYVAPHPRPVDGTYNPYAMERLSKVGRRVMRLANLPEELRLMDLRRTGVTQMDKEGVPINQIMSVTGHNNISSVKPYLKHSYTSANNALTQRNISVSLSGTNNIESDIL
jgi:integrase